MRTTEFNVAQVKSIFTTIESFDQADFVDNRVDPGDAGKWDMGPLRRDSGLPWIVPPVPWYCGIGRTVGYGALKEGQWIPMDNPACPMVQWDPIGF